MAEKVGELTEEYIYQGRIGICGPREAGEFNQHGIAAVMIAKKGQPLLSDHGNWENIQCEIIIRPIKRLGEAKIPGLRLDHVAQALGDDSQWKQMKLEFPEE
jgi:hypothetical protein